MTPEDWKRIKTIFDEAVELAPEERHTVFEFSACTGDGILRSEVESLLASLEEAGGFIEKTGGQPSRAG